MVDQWNGIESQETDRHEYNQLQFPTDSVETAGHPHWKKKRNRNTDFIPSGKLIQIGLYYLNIKHKTKKLSENHLG